MLESWYKLSIEERSRRTTMQKIYEEELLESGVEKYWREYGRVL